MATYLGAVPERPNHIPDILNLFAQQVQQRKAQNNAEVQQLIQSGQYAPTGQAQPQGLLGKIGYALSGPNVGGPNMNVGGMSYQFQTPETKMANLQKQLAMIQGMQGNQQTTQGSQTGPQLGNLPSNLPNYQVSPGSIDLNAGTVSPKISMTTPLEQAEYQSKLLDIQKKQEEARNANAGLGDIGSKTPEELQVQLKEKNPAYARYLQAVADGKVTLAGRQTKQIAQIQKDLVNLYPNFDQNKINARYKTRQDFTTGVAAKNIKSLNTAVNHLNEMNKIIPRLDNHGFKQWNQLAQTVHANITGFPELARFKAIKTALSGELSNIYKNSGGTDQEIQHVSDTIDSADSPESLKASIQEAMTLMGGRLNALQDQWHNAFDQPNDQDFPVISPRSKSLLKGMGFIEDTNTSQKEQAPMQGKYQVGQILPIGNKKYRVTGGDPNDPDIEEVKNEAK